MAKLATLYRATRERIESIVAGRDADAATISVPACPGWSVKDVVAHVTGNCTDVLSGNVAGLATTEWTDAQVQARRDWKLGDVLAEWDDVGPKFAALLDEFPGQYGRQALCDLVVHEHDLRGAVGLPGERDSQEVAIATDFLVGVMARTAAKASGLPPLEIRAGDRGWIVGTGSEPSGDDETWRQVVAESPAPADWVQPVGRVDVEAFELFRALSGRRSAAQIKRFDWSLDPTPFLPLFDYGPFHMREDDLEE